ncbi:glycosyltransferase [Alicyclobacillus mengziensis]|uniref:Glycosyltransferase family 2 protein n=1 Tax=Alicyclobacillus mengziensis TaxID=2931921 RepID=A0A9X7VYQ6_9BACL|nr:glycosyltransferase family 2 protein [Alicyclobacillus mengziensis]QSO47025.1 glycosyltransferase family 2 protein [Alicyclobacillus mengziensis]
MLLSIIIPTFNERGNVQLIVERVEAAMKDSTSDYEIWFVDDSRDDTPIILEGLANSHPQVHYLHRENGRGLATAVVEGFSRAAGQYFIVMDADLQHPPELLPTILERLQEGTDVVIPSRFVRGGSDGGLNPFRKIVSWTARVIGRLAISRIRRISDCTGGYFGLSREVVADAKLNPIGWKILLEILVKGQYQTVHEIPYEFHTRDVGESKMNTREQWNYIRHIVRLVAESPEDRRLYLFAMVGALGVVVNLVAMSVLLYGLHVRPTMVASILASLVAMLHNFLWNDKVTWKAHAHPVKWRRMMQMPMFMLVSLVGIGITALFAQWFTLMGSKELIGQCLGIIVATGWSFVANNRITWRTPESHGAKRTRRKVRVTQE